MRARVQASFGGQAMMATLGADLVSVEPGPGGHSWSAAATRSPTPPPRRSRSCRPRLPPSLTGPASSI